MRKRLGEAYHLALVRASDAYDKMPPSEKKKHKSKAAFLQAKVGHLLPIQKRDAKKAAKPNGRQGKTSKGKKATNTNEMWKHRLKRARIFKANLERQKAQKQQKRASKKAQQRQELGIP